MQKPRTIRRIESRDLDLPDNFWTTWPEDPKCKLIHRRMTRDATSWHQVAERVLKGEFDDASRDASRDTVRSAVIGIRGYSSETAVKALKHLKTVLARRPRLRKEEQDEELALFGATE